MQPISVAITAASLLSGEDVVGAKLASESDVGKVQYLVETKRESYYIYLDLNKWEGNAVTLSGRQIAGRQSVAFGFDARGKVTFYSI